MAMAPHPFFAEFRDGSYGLNTKRSSMEHPQCTCGRLVMPGLQMRTHRGTLELHLKGRLTLAQRVLRIWP